MSPALLNLPLSLRPAAAPGGVSAWFIPGADVRGWLDEIFAWGVSPNVLRLCFIPRSHRDPSPRGALVIGAGLDKVRPSPIVQGYTALADRLYIPVEACLHPPMSPAEVAAKLPLPAYVLHPAIGLIGYDQGDLHRPIDLLRAPAPSPARWDRGVPGIELNQRLLSVEPIPLPRIEQIIDNARDDIGGASPSELPPLPDESPLRQLANRTKLGAMSAMHWLARQLPGSGSGAGQSPGWLDGLQQWLGGKMDALRSSLERARQAELARLLKLLQDNPDEALRYALPLNSVGSRGIAPPGARLTHNTPDFNWHLLNRSYASDAWQSSAAALEQLRARYREAANRELALKRYRRAAYVFAHLLGDFAAAANALQQGRFYREAAMLYQERLNNAPAAAQCLEEGGLLLQAIAIYLLLGRHDKVGDLYRRLEREAEACEAYRAAADVLCQRQDIVGAARIIDGKLNDVHAALALLDGAWPDARQAVACLQEMFSLWRRLGAHRPALRRIARLLADPLPSRLVSSVAGALATLARGYPNPEVRHDAADATRVVVGRYLPAAGIEELPGLTAAVAQTAEEDQLLRRDSGRYPDIVRRQRHRLPPRAPAPTRPSKPPPLLVRTFELGREVKWRHVLAADSRFLVLGGLDGNAVLCGGNWHGAFQRSSALGAIGVGDTYEMALLGRDQFGLAIVPLRNSPALAGPLLKLPSVPGVLPVLEPFRPRFIPNDDIEAFCVDDQGVAWIVRRLPPPANRYPMLESYDPETGAIQSSHHVLTAEDDDTGPVLRIAARTGHVFLLYPHWVDQFPPNRSWRRIGLPRPAVNLIASAPFMRTRLIVTFNEGAALFNPPGDEVAFFASEIENPSACMTRDGRVVVVGAHRGAAYRVQLTTVALECSFEAARIPPLAVCPTPESGGFAIFYPDGTVRVMRLP